MTDSAANELLAGQIGRGRRENADARASTELLTPNLLLVGRDLPHALRRVLQKPYKADKYLEDVMEEVVVSKSSMVQRVWNSPQFSAWFAEEMQRQDLSVFKHAVKNLRAAKHRFESLTTPLGRFVLHMPAMFATLCRMADSAGHTRQAVMHDVRQFLRAVDVEIIAARFVGRRHG